MIHITKYHGLGNDFIIIDDKNINEENASNLAITLCDRHTSIGADGLIIVKRNPLEMVYYNSDGSRAKMCGNGIRCFAAYCVDEGIINQPEFEVVTLAGTLQLKIENFNPFLVTVNMGKPDFTSSEIPMNINQDTFINQPITIQGETFIATSMKMNVTHTSIEVKDLSIIDMTKIGKEIQSLDYFPDSTNVNYYQVLNSKEIKTQTYERGAGLTLACGTGACSVYVASKLKGQMENKMTVHLPLGDLIISEDEEGNILMTGPAVKVIEGQMEI